MSLESLLEALKKEYLSSLPHRIADLENQFRQGQMDQVRECFHKLNGTGKTYGLPEISTLSEKMEHLCVQRAPQLAEQIPLAIDLLRTILTVRSADQEFVLTKDERYLKILKSDKVES